MVVGPNRTIVMIFHGVCVCVSVCACLSARVGLSAYICVSLCHHCSHYLVSVSCLKQSKKWQSFTLTFCHSGSYPIPLPVSLKDCPTLLS